jgi:hypothetical protein
MARLKNRARKQNEQTAVDVLDLFDIEAGHDAFFDIEAGHHTATDGDNEASASLSSFIDDSPVSQGSLPAFGSDGRPFLPGQHNEDATSPGELQTTTSETVRLRFVVSTVLASPSVPLTQT